MSNEAKMALRVLWTIFWFLVLVYFSYWIAFFCAFWYILLLAFVPFMPALKNVEESLHKGVRMPYLCSDNMRMGRSLNDGIQVICS
ncbi:secreted protein, putative [Ixodes scapularis]|uniref:Secreted protein, putative n=1 Tax=Ixodes scapularis TaxID=6945 RepID=B7Q153_IXOSC|nr:secreted protein, putative [Ixodes scapularis]|eukprot:XP_002408937.1 secreted protein, putative [Ixodes scapularis]